MWRSVLQRHEPLVRTLGGTTAVGMVLGFLIGGVLGRLAMRALFLTSGPGVRGVISDDGFAIGQFTLDTLNLLLSSAGFGIFGAFIYLAVRPFLIGPLWLRSVACALAGGAVIGSVLVGADGVDFTLLSPVWFAIALFVAIPALFGAVAPPAMEWVLQPGGWARTGRLGWVSSPLLVYLFPPLLVLIGVPLAIVVAGRYCVDRWPILRRAAQHSSAMWTARAVWLAVASFGGLLLWEDLLALL